MTKESLSNSLKDFWELHCPIKRMGKLEELAEVVLFLGSDAASFVNGQAISVTGGLDWAE
jgi:NAD(P)-dependent dehydrogenase (short-subunit alcohol dehydrogenase family)